MSKYKVLTHYLAVAALAVYGFALSPAGKALVEQYPKLATIATAIVTIGALYYKSARP